MQYPKRLIEIDLPIFRISAHSRREKSLRHGHISTLHLWWARRPLAACRAVLCAALWPDPVDLERFQDSSNIQPALFLDAARLQMEQWLKDVSQSCDHDTLKFAHLKPNLSENKLLQTALFHFIADFSKWENGNHENWQKIATILTRAAHESLGGLPGSVPMVMDPFAGGGSIPLEAARIGAQALASDLNPVPVILNKILLEYLPRHGDALPREVRAAGARVAERAAQKLNEFYPKDSDGSAPLAYLWARTILSEAPSEDGIPVEVPMLRSLWLCNKKNKYKALRWVRDENQQVLTDVVEVDYENGERLRVRRPRMEIFEPEKVSLVEGGTMVRGAATCPVSGYTTPVASIRQQMKERKGGADDARLFAVVFLKGGIKGRYYRLPRREDEALALSARKQLKIESDNHKGPFSLVPNEPLPPPGALGFRVQRYGMVQWGHLFTSRQLLTLTTLGAEIRAEGEALMSQLSEPLAEAVQTCLASAVNRAANQYCSLAKWNSIGEKVDGVFARQALPMLWDFGEFANPFLKKGYWEGAINWVGEVLESTPRGVVGSVLQASASRQPASLKGRAAAVVTDPPYYDAVPYSDLSDFFYVWFRRNLPEVHGPLFEEPLSPKDDECIVDETKAKDRGYFEETMTFAMKDSKRTLSPGGIGVVVFAHKSTEGWEAMLKAMIDAGWVITGSWPIDTERGNRLRAMDSAALASSIHLVCRPREEDAEIGEWRDVLGELPQKIRKWMQRLTEEGVVGADAIFACLGPALEIYSRFKWVEKASGDIIQLGEYLEHVWSHVSNEALATLFARENASAGGFEPEARLTAMWLWTMKIDKSSIQNQTDPDDLPSQSKGWEMPYDTGRKIAQGLGIHLEKASDVVAIEGEMVRLLPVRERTPFLFGKEHHLDTRPMARKKNREVQLGLFQELEQEDALEGEGSGSFDSSPARGCMDRIHQAMLLFATGKGGALKAFLKNDQVGRDHNFWKLAQALVALYPEDSEEKRWLESVMAMKKSMNL